MQANAPDHRPGAYDARYGTEALSPGSVHPVCSASSFQKLLWNIEHDRRWIRKKLTTSIHKPPSRFILRQRKRRCQPPLLLWNAICPSPVGGRELEIMESVFRAHVSEGAYRLVRMRRNGTLELGLRDDRRRAAGKAYRYKNEDEPKIDLLALIETYYDSPALPTSLSLTLFHK